MVMFKNILAFFTIGALGITTAFAAETHSKEQESIYLESYGWAFGNQPAINLMHLAKDEIPFVLKGFEKALLKQDSPVEIEGVAEEINAFISQRTKTEEGKAVTAAHPGKKEKLYLEVFGWAMGTQPSMRMLGLSSDEAALVLAGFRKSLYGEKPSVDVPKIVEEINTYAVNRAESYRAKRENELAKEAMQNMEIEKPFYEELAKNENVKKTASGLYYEITKAGSQEHPASNSDVKVDYTGALINGDVFDSSHKRGEPITFNLQGVISGWREGLQLVGKGGSIRLYIPPQLAYGNQDIPGIPPGSTLVFDVDLIDIL